ncbi:MAG: Pantothenate kinase [Candidatus Brocadiaceae bacterium]|nr:Pantothenate kinase [Candidatus Brocadiaceae bacterium]
MWLAIDIGNTNIHIGIFEDDVLHSSYSVPQAVVLSSVNPKVEVFVIEYIQKHFFVNPQFIGKDIPIPMAVLTDQPDRVGVDRLVNALAAFERTKSWTIVVDAGTAITVDVINDGGAFMGGIIAPGMGISSKALHHYTALLPEIPVNKPKTILGKNTESAINSGIYWGTVGMVSRLISMLCDELKCQGNPQNYLRNPLFDIGGDQNCVQEKSSFKFAKLMLFDFFDQFSISNVFSEIG